MADLMTDVVRSGST